MEIQAFQFSWSALWLWMHSLETECSGYRFREAFTHRKGQVSLLLERNGDTRLLTWTKHGNRAQLQLFLQAGLPKKRVQVLRSLPQGAEMDTVTIHARDRLLRLNFSEGHGLILGFYPEVLNVFHMVAEQSVGQFLKQPTGPHAEPFWLSTADPLPDPLPGKGISQEVLRQGLEGLRLDPGGEHVHFGTDPNQTSFPIYFLEKAQKTHTQPGPVNEAPDQVQRSGKTVLKRWKRKRSQLQDELCQAQSWPQLAKELEDLQMAQALKIPIQDETLTLPAQYSSDQVEIRIQLLQGEDLKSAIASRAKRIKKAKLKLEHLENILIQVNTEIEELTHLLAVNESNDLRAFLEGKGETFTSGKHEAATHTPYKKYTSPGGFDILVGRSSRDNDVLTFKIAHKEDYWFHTRNIRGSHVILRTGKQEPTKEDLLVAARHAAEHSKAKHSGLVVVQYCQRKHLTKPKGSAPGAVLVHQEQSLTIDLEN